MLTILTITAATEIVLGLIYWGRTCNTSNIRSATSR